MGCADANVLVAFAAGDMTPRRRQVLAEHIDDCPVCADAVAGAAAELDREADSDRATVPTPNKPVSEWGRGDSAGRFVILERVGAGGLGTVYAAYDPDLDRRVAIKVLHDGVARHLVREARALAQVSHPNVVPVHELGEIDGHAFIAMELVAGQTLRTWLADKERSWTAIRDVFVDAARGLAAVHDAGLVHRDVKPGNIIVGLDGRARVLDLGLAHLGREPPASAEGGQGTSVVSATEGLAGTPAYMAPEQYRTSSVDPRADQFGLCVALFEALHDQRPYTSETLKQTTTGSSLPAPAGSGSARGPRWLRQVAIKGLALDPDDRYPTMNALADALVADRRARRRQRWAIAALVLTTATVAGSIGLVLADQPSPQQHDAVEELTAEALAAGARSYFVYPPVDEPDFRTALVVVEEIDVLDETAAAGLREQFAGTLVRLGDRYWDQEGGRGFASDYYVQALLFAPEHERASERAFVSPGQLAALAETARNGRFSPAVLGAAEPLAALAERDPERRRRRVEALSAIGEVTRSKLARIVGPSPLAQGPDPSPAAMRPEAPVPSAQATEEANTEATAGTGSTREGVDPASSPASSEAHGGAPSRDPDRARALTARGRTAMRGRKLDEAAAAFRQALAAKPRHVPALLGLAEAYFEQGQLGAAVRTAEQARAAAPDNGRVQLLLGDLYRKVRRYDAARAAYETADALGHRHAEAKLEALNRAVK